LGIELEEYQKADFDYQTTVASVFSIARRAKQIFESSEPKEKRVFLNYLLQNPTVKAKSPTFTLRSPFNLVLELTSSPLRGAVVEDVRTIFERRNDATIYIPDMQSIAILA
jgi:hypothetical protein